MPKLSIDIEARMAQFQDSLNKMGNDASRTARQMDRAFSGLGSTIRAVGGAFAALGIGLSVGAIVGMVKSVSELQDRFGKLAQETGVGVEALTSLDYAAKLSGVSTEELSKGLVKLGEQITRVRQGDKTATNLFKTLGIDPKSLKSSDDALLSVAERFSQMKDGVEKTNLAVALFGERIGPGLIPLLNAGRQGIEELKEEARRLGVVFDEEAAKNAEKLNDNLERLRTQFEGLKIQFFGPIIESLANLTRRFIDARNANLGFLDSLRIGVAGDYGNINVQVEQQKKLVAQLEKAAKAKMDFYGRPVDEGLGIVRQRELDAAKNKLDELLEVQQKIANVEGGQQSEPFDAYIPGQFKPGTETKQTAEKLSAAQRYLESLRSQREALASLTVYEKLLYDVQMGRLGQVNNTELSRLSTLAQEIDAVRELEVAQKREADFQQFLAKLKQDAFDRDQSDRKAELDSLERQANAWMDMVDPMREFIRNIERVDRALAAGFFGEGLDAEKMASNIKAALAGVGEELSKLDEFALQAARNIQDALGDAVFNFLDGKFEDIGKSFGNMIKRMAAEAIAADLGRTLLGDFAKTGKVGGIFGAIIGSFGGTRAGGGPVMGGTAYLVGEKGPELFVPQMNGSIVPNGAGGVTVNQSISVGGGASRSEVAAAMALAKDSAKREILESMRRGGVFA